MTILMMDDEHNMMPTEIGWWISDAIVKGCMSDPISDELIQHYKKLIWDITRKHWWEVVIQTIFAWRRVHWWLTQIPPTFNPMLPPFAYNPQTQITPQEVQVPQEEMLQMKNLQEQIQSLLSSSLGLIMESTSLANSCTSNILSSISYHPSSNSLKNS